MPDVHQQSQTITFQRVDEESIKGEDQVPDVQAFFLRQESDPLFWAGIAIFGPSTFEAVTFSRETYYVIDGEATLEVEGQISELRPGDLIDVPNGTRARYTVRRALKLFFVQTP